MSNSNLHLNVPLVTVIITCYNHELYVEQALASVLDQKYPSLEIFIVDDFSTDNSKTVLLNLKEKYSEVTLILNEKNLGICRSFNQAFFQSKGEYIIDLAADDYLLPEKISSQVAAFQALPSHFGVIYSDLLFVDKNNKQLPDQRKSIFFPKGDVFTNVLARHCIYACTMLVKREVLEELNGYNEQLTYEDFDFLIRASRNWYFSPLHVPLIAKRELNTSLGKNFNNRNDNMRYSTYLICLNSKRLINSSSEKKALLQRLLFEAKDAFMSSDWKNGLRFMRLLIA